MILAIASFYVYNMLRLKDIGLSPSGKATDSDSVTSKVRILPAQ